MAEEEDPGSTPSLMGRTKSFHSTRLREKSQHKQEIKRQLEEVQQEEYEEGQYVAVRWADPPHFWLARVEEDKGDKLVVMWLDPKGKIYIEDAQDTIKKATVLLRVSMGKKGKKYTLSAPERKKIHELVKLDAEDGEFVDSDEDDDEDKDTVPKVGDEEEEEDTPMKDDDDDEEFELLEKKGKGKGKKKALDSDEESAEEETPKKARKGRGKRKADGDGDSAGETPKKGRSKRKAPESGEDGTPKKKRTPRKKKATGDEDDGGEGPSTPAAKRRKGATKSPGTATRKRSKKRVPEINPDIPVIEVDPRIGGTDDHLHTNCCTYCTTKEAIRAVLTKNMTLLKTIVNDRTHVYDMNTRRSADVAMNALLYAIRTSNFEAFKMIWEEQYHPTNKEPNKARKPRISLGTQGTGHYTNATYGHGVRAINMSRGGKEGNNAFTADQEYYSEDEFNNDETWLPTLVYELMRNKNTTQEFILWMITNMTSTEFFEHLADCVFVAVQEGNRELAIFLVDYLIKRDGWGFNNLHLQSLTLNGGEFEKFRSPSVIKKPIGNNAITPVHMAAINPNPKYLKALLSVQPAFDIADGIERRPVHYAAACSSTAPLQFLMSKSIDFMSPDLCGTTPLMIAARLGLLENINLMLRGYMSRNKLKSLYENTDFHTKIAEQITKHMGGDVKGKEKVTKTAGKQDSKSGGEVKPADKNTEAPGDQDEDEGMEDSPATKKNDPVLPLKEMSREELDSIINPLEEILDFAMLFANEEAQVEEEPPADENEDGFKLAETKKVPYIDATDDNGYSALFYAVESNQPKAVELLIYRHASVELIDASGKKITPLILASQLGHLECVKTLIEKGKAGVDTPDKLKRSPLIHAAKNGHLPVLSYLLHRGANGDAADSSGNTVMHYAAAFGWSECVKFLIEKGKVAFNAVNDWKLTPFQIALAKSHLACLDVLLQQPGIDLNVRGENGCTALVQTCINFQAENLPIVKFIIEKGADATIPDANGNTPLHFVAQTIHNHLSAHSVEAAELLLAHKAQIDAKNSSEETPLDLVIKANKWYATEFLLSKGALLPPKEGTNILHNMMSSITTSDNNLLTLMKTISDHPNFGGLAKQTNDDGYTPFLICVQRYSAVDFMQKNVQTHLMERNTAMETMFTTAIEIFLNKLKLDPSESVQHLRTIPSPPNEVGDLPHPESYKFNGTGRKTALHFLATQTDTSFEVFKTILSHKPNLNALDINGETPLLLAIREIRGALTQEQWEKVSTPARLLLDAGAYVVDKPDPAPFMLNPTYYAQNIPSPLVAVLSQRVTRAGQRDESLAVRLLNMGANPRGCADWDTLKVHKCFIPSPLQVALENSMEETVKLLIEKGAHVNAESREGIPENLLKAELPSPLYVAIQKGHKFVKMLIDARADVNFTSRSTSVPQYSTLSTSFLHNAMTPIPKPETAKEDWEGPPPPALCHPLTTAVQRGDLRSAVALITAKSDLYAEKGKAPTPIHLAARHIDILAFILSLKDVDYLTPDHKGDMLLHYIINETPTEISRRRFVEKLVKEKKVDINVPGSDKRTALHYAINKSTAAEDANFDFETFLIDQGANINLRDADGRTPLHYAFVKMGLDEFTNKSQADPIEVVTSLCAYKELELDVVDRFGRTPLHYAAQRGALISTLFLLQKGVMLDREDSGGNTPLGIALCSRHPQYALILIREKADVRHPLYLGSFAEVKDKQGTVISHGKFQVVSKVTMFSEVMKHDWQGIVYLMLYSGFDYLEAMQDAISAGRFKLTMTLLNKTKEDDVVRACHPTTQETLMHYLAHCSSYKDSTADAVVLAHALRARGVALDTLNSTGSTPFHFAAKNRFYELAVLLLGKTEGEIAFEPVITDRIPPAISLSKAPHFANKHNETPLTYFIGSRSTVEGTNMLQLLLRTGADKDTTIVDYAWQLPKNKDKDQTRPNISCLQQCLRRGLFNFAWNFIAYGANPNVQHPNDGNTILMDLVEKNNMKEIQTLVMSVGSFKIDPNIPDNQGVTPMAKAVISHNLDLILTLLNISGNFKVPIDLGLCGHEGKSPIMHAVCDNNLQILELLLNGKTIVNPSDPNKYAVNTTPAVEYNINAAGKNGWTAVHYVVNPLEDEFGSYENIKILELLQGKGADLNAKDNSKRTPLHYASMQDSGKLARALTQLGAAELPKGLGSRLQSSIFEWPDNGLNFNLDAQKVLDSIDESEAEALAVDDTVPVDPLAKDAGKVLCDEVKTKDGKKKVYYDVLMTIVDIAHGTYGINNFYKMQVLRDEVRDLYILWTRWGRIGDTGQFQRTPFPSAEEAKKEFCKIFKTKSGNSWDDKDNFERKPKKYKLITNEHVPQKSRFMKDILEQLAKFLASKSARDAPLPLEMTLAMQQFTNTSILQKAMVQAGFNMQLYKLTDGTLEDARKVLLTLKEVILKLDASRTVQPPPGVDELLKSYETINTLSNQYYELIPHTNYSRAAIPPLDTSELVQAKLTALQSLVDVEVACKILMGAQYRMKEMHPLMYCFTSLEIKAEPLPKSGKEFNYLLKYISNTHDHQVRACTRPLSQLDRPDLQKEPYHLEVVSILKIQRKGEAERIGKWKSMENHRLLWHGSPSSNFLGILSQGLRIAPPEAPVSGYAFGKGVYFADCFAKSFGYCRGDKDAFLILSEVALGKIFTVDSSKVDAPHIGYDTVEAPLGFNSVHSPGQQGPDWNKSIVMPNGVSIPTEKSTQQQQQQQHYRYNSYGYSEYIVYDPSQVRMRYLVHVRTN